MAVKFSNNAKTTLSSGITSSATSITVADGSVFPSISGSDYFYVTLEVGSDADLKEIVKCTARSGNTLTITRGQDGTSARTFSNGDKCELRLTAAGLNDVATQADTDTTYTAGSGLSLTGSEFANTAPDQTVALTGAGATSISGTYPNFTITSTDTNTDTDTTYTAGSGLSLTGTEFANTAPDQTVTLTGAGTTTVSGTYPNFTITGSGGTYTAGTGITLTGTEFSIGQDVATTASPTFAAINVNGLVTSDDFQIDLGTATAAAQITTPSALSGFQAFSIKNTSTEGYLSFGTTLGQARIQATGANGSADPLDIDVGGITAIGIADDGAVTMGGDVTLDAGLTGDAILTIRADSDNNNEGDHPSIRFKQDGDLVDWRIGIGSTDSDTGTYNNDFCITHNAGGTNGLKYVTAGGNLVHTIWHSGNDGAGSGLDADNLDGVTWGSLDKDVGAVNFNVDAGNLNGLRFWNGSNSYRISMSASGISGAGRVAGETTSDYNMYFKMTGGTNRGFVFQSDTANRAGIDASGNIRTVANVDCNYLRADRIYSNNDGSTGYFYNDSGTRTAYKSGDFYIQSSVGNCYIYATNTYLGSTSGDVIHTRGNQVGGNGFQFSSNGDFYVNARYGSNAMAFACRAWGRYEMIGTHSWRDDEGFSSITDLGTGRSRINFTNAMPNTYYSVQVTAGSTSQTNAVCAAQVYSTTTSSFSVDNEDLDSGFTDRDNMHIAVFR